MTSNPALTEKKYTKSQRLSPRFSSGAKIFGHVLHSTELVRKCLACQHFDINSADWISHNLHVISSWYLWTMGKEFIFRFSRRSRAGTRDQPLRTSAWEANGLINDVIIEIGRVAQHWSPSPRFCSEGMAMHRLYTGHDFLKWPVRSVGSYKPLEGLWKCKNEYIKIIYNIFIKTHFRS